MLPSSDIRNDANQNRAIFDLVQGFIGMLSPEGTLLDANQSALNFVGVDLHEVVGTPFWETPWWRDCQTSQDALKDAIRSAESGEAVRFEAMHTGKKGEIIYVDFLISPIFNDAGIVTSLLAEAHDITTIKQTENSLYEAEARLRLAYDAAGIGAWESDLTNNILHWNDRQFELFGIPKPAGKMQIERALANVHPDDLERVTTANAVSVKNGVPFREEFRVIRDDGEIRWLFGQGDGLHLDENGKLKSMIGVNYDITEQKNLELKLTQSNLNLEARVAKRTRELEQEVFEREKVQEALSHSQRLELIGQLAGGVAHDFNNLLAVIGGNLELAMLRKADEQISELIQEALDAVEAGASLTQRLLSFARKSSIEPATIAVNSRISNMKHLLERTLDDSIRFETALSPEVWETFVDPGELDSAILNLVVNARDAMPSGGKLSIVTRNRTFNADDAKSIPEAQEIEYVQLSVSDTGTGMTPDVLDKAVTPFFTTKELGKGSGLGLSSVFGFAKQSAGFVAIESVEKKGTTIDIYLPRSSSLSNGRLMEPPEGAMPLGHGELVLVVEDDIAVLSITRNRLIELGYNVIESTTVTEAIQLLETNQPVSLVLSDVRIPGRMSGYDLAKWVFENRSEIKVLLTSGYNDFRDEGQKSVKMLAKPYTIKMLAISLHDALVVANDR